MSDLIVIKFEGTDTAERALESVRGVQGSGAFGLNDTAVVASDASGNIRVKNEWSTGAETGAVVGGFVGAIVTFVFPPAGAAIGAGFGALIGSKLQTGVEKGFVEDVAAALTPNTSALFLVVKSGGAADAVVTAFRQFQGTVYHTTLSPDLEDSLRRALTSTA